MQRGEYTVRCVFIKQQGGGHLEGPSDIVGGVHKHLPNTANNGIWYCYAKQ